MNAKMAKVFMAVLVALTVADIASGASERNVTGQLDGTGLIGVGGCPPGPFGDHWVHLQENVLVDSYDSRLGEYDPDNPGSNANAGSNCNGVEPDGVSIDNNAIVKGDVTVSTPLSDGDIVIAKSTVTGAKIYDAPLWTLKPVIMPTWYTAAGDTKIHGTYGSKSGCYEITNKKFIAYNGAIVTFDPGEFHFDHFELSNNVDFKIGGGPGMVEIYIGTKADASPYIGTGSIVFENNSELLPPIQFKGDTTRLRLYFNGTTKVDLSNNVTFFGFIYAPNALIEAKNNDKIYGNLVAKEVYLWNNAGVHYDQALASKDFGSILGPPQNPPKATDWKEEIK